MRFLLTPGQRHDMTQAEALIEGLPAGAVLGDKGYDGGPFRAAIAAQGAVAVIPPKANAPRHLCDFALYRERNLVERFFNRIKQFRRIATRYDKTARSFLAFLTLVAAVIWLA